MSDKENAINLLASHFAKENDNVDHIRDEIWFVLRDYEIKKAETGIVEYSGNKNEMLLRNFLIAKTVQGCSKKTLEMYQKSIGRMLLQFHKPCDEVTSEDIRAFIVAKEFRDGCSKSYCNTLLLYLRTFYSFLVEEDVIVKSPCDRVKRIKVEKKKKKAFTEIEVEKIRNGCRNSREKAIVEVLLSTGCRVSELCSIKISDIREDKIDILGKGNKHRPVYLNAKATLAIEAYLNDREDKNPYLFPKSCASGIADNCAPEMRTYKEEWYKRKELVSDSEPLDKSSVEALIRKLGKRAGVDSAYPHKFRRTCATMALRRGMPIEQVSKMLGHEELSTTQIYLDITEHDLEEAHRKFVG